MRSDLRSADGGDRTHTHLRELDFESSASANSATSALVRRQFVIRLARNASANGREQVHRLTSPYLISAVFPAQLSTPLLDSEFVLPPRQRVLQ
jgi:hypothetical protein